MRRTHARIVIIVIAAGIWGPMGLSTASQEPAGRRAAAVESTDVPIYVLDPTWPKLPLPNRWAVGPVVGASVDAQDRLWVVHRSRGFRPLQSECCDPAPAV